MKCQFLFVVVASGAKKGCPKIVAVVPLSTNVNVNECILRGITGEADTNNGASSQSVLNVFMKKQKTQCTFVTNPTRDVISILDIAKVADVILLVTGVANNSSASAFDTVSFCVDNMYPFQLMTNMIGWTRHPNLLESSGFARNASVCGWIRQISTTEGPTGC